MATRILNLDIPESIHKRIKVFAAQEGRPAKEVTVKILDAGLEVLERATPPGGGSR